MLQYIFITITCPITPSHLSPIKAMMSSTDSIVFFSVHIWIARSRQTMNQNFNHTLNCDMLRRCMNKSKEHSIKRNIGSLITSRRQSF